MSNSGVIGRFRAWLRSRSTRPFEYHRGFLALDRMRTGRFAPFVSYAVDRVGSMALRAYEEGKVTLVQKKIGPGVTSYLAVKRKEKQ